MIDRRYKIFDGLVEIKDKKTSNHNPVFLRYVEIIVLTWRKVPRNQCKEHVAFGNPTNIVDVRLVYLPKTIQLGRVELNSDTFVNRLFYVSSSTSPDTPH